MYSNKSYTLEVRWTLVTICAVTPHSLVQLDDKLWPKQGLADGIILVIQIRRVKIGFDRE